MDSLFQDQFIYIDICLYLKVIQSRSLSVSNVSRNHYFVFHIHVIMATSSVNAFLKNNCTLFNVSRCFTRNKSMNSSEEEYTVSLKTKKQASLQSRKP